MKQYYRDRMTFSRWDDTHIIGYLGETVVKDYTPDTPAVDDETPVAFDAYCYEGSMPDGGTVMPCNDSSSRDDLANAIIRSKYSESEESAIKRHHMLLQDDATISKADEYKTEWTDFNAWCDYAIKTADIWLD